MRSNFNRKLILVLLLALLCSVMTPAAFADYTDDTPYYSARIFTDGLLSGRGYLYISTYYMPLEGLCRLAGADVSSSAQDGYYTLSGSGFELQYWEGDHYLCVNNRYYYSANGFPCINGRVYVPVSLAERLFSVTACIQDGCIHVNTSGICLPSGWAGYYEDTFGEDSVWWLSHIIHAEAYREGFEGHLGVGNVVMNRVASPLYPDTVAEVVSDTDYGLQFDGTTDEAFEEEPDSVSLITAYLALEGYSVVGDSLFFIVPEACDITWFEQSLEYYTDIDNLRFYRLGG